MSETEVTREAQRGIRLGIQAVPGSSVVRRWETQARRTADGAPGRVHPLLWQAGHQRPGLGVARHPGYLFLGGLAGASSLLGTGAQLIGRPSLARPAKAGAFGAGLASAGDRKYTVVPQRDRLRHRDRPSAEPS